jgi:hypothetical protein
MKRVLLSACLVVGSFGLAGCDSGGIQEGMPEDTKTNAVDLNQIGADASKGPKMPTGGATGKGAPKAAEAPGTPPAPDATKN